MNFGISRRYAGISPSGLGIARKAGAACDASRMALSFPADIVQTCPRCAEPLVARFYGPCEPCREELRRVYTAVAREVVVEEYMPKMNVTPNAVASKD